jgi:FtsP/CotA-like multicopper oxidase with cupredoxin domain
MNPGKICQLRWTVLLGLAVLVFVPVCAFAQTATTTGSSSPTPVPLVANPCSRFTSGSVIHNPPALYSQSGVLNVRFSYQTTTDSFGRQLYCFMTPDGLENPTLHINPGDTLNITVTNNTPFNDADMNESDEPFQAPNCGDATFELNSLAASTGSGPPANPPPPTFGMTSGSMNIHYHGTNTSPACHGDNVTKTLINPSLTSGSPASTFQYNVLFPTNEPPGLYWYHPHVHMLAEAAVFGGASGALIVDGINNVQPAVGGMSERVIVIRDQQFTDPTLSEACCNSTNTIDGQIPQRDLSVNFVPLNTTVARDGNGNLISVSYTPAVVYMQPGKQQFWRVCNCNSDAPLDLQVRFDGVAQTIQIVGIDAVPVNSQDGPQPPALIPVTHFRIPPASRVEFIVNAPSSSVKLAQFVTQFIYSGPIGDTLPTRPLLTMQLVNNDTEKVDNRIPASTGLVSTQKRFGGIEDDRPALTRTLYFEEYQDGTQFFVNASGCVTASGAQCKTQPYNIDTPFDNNNAPAFITTQGTVEKWIVQNHANENHELHQHQVHFKVLSQDHFDDNCTPVGAMTNCGMIGSRTCQTCAPAINGQFLDMIEIPYCGGDPAGPPNMVNKKPVGPPIPAACITTNNGTGPPIPYPQVQLLVDFRGPDIGDFVFHCHILGHEDLGMMAIERVVQKDE